EAVRAERLHRARDPGIYFGAGQRFEVLHRLAGGGIDRRDGHARLRDPAESRGTQRRADHTSLPRSCDAPGFRPHGPAHSWVSKTDCQSTNGSINVMADEKTGPR